MEIEKLIERLNGLYTALREEGEQKCSPEINTVAFVLMDAATSLSTLQAKNESLLAEVEHWRNAHHQAALNFQQENRECNKVLAELEQVKRELQAYKDTGLEPEDFKRAFHEDAVLKLAGQALGIAPDRLRELAQADKEGISPCTFCRFNPPSSGDGKPCCMCPAEAALRREQDG